MSNADADEYKIEVDSIAISLKKTGLNQVTLTLTNQQDKPVAIDIPSPDSREKEKGVFFLWGGNEEKIVYNNVQPTYQWEIKKVVGAGYDTLCTIKMSDIEQGRSSTSATAKEGKRQNPTPSASTSARRSSMNRTNFKPNKWYHTNEASIIVSYKRNGNLYTVSIANIGNKEELINIQKQSTCISPGKPFSINIQTLDNLQIKIHTSRGLVNVRATQKEYLRQSHTSTSHDENNQRQHAESEQKMARAQKLEQVTKSTSPSPVVSVDVVPKEQLGELKNRIDELESKLGTLPKQWTSFKQQYDNQLSQYETLKGSMGTISQDVEGLKNSMDNKVMPLLGEGGTYLTKAQNIVVELEKVSSTAQKKIQEIQEYREDIEPKYIETQQLEEDIRKNLAESSNLLNDIREAREDIFKIKDEIRGEIIEAQEAQIQAVVKQSELENRLKRLDEFGYQDLERKREECAGETQRAATEIQNHYLAKIAPPDAGSSSNQQQEKVLSDIFSLITKFKEFVKGKRPGYAMPKTVTAVERLLEETLQTLQLPLPKFIIPDVPSPKEYEQQQANNLAKMALTESPPEELPPEKNYTEYVKQEYWNALLAYKKELSEAKPEENLLAAQGNIDGVLKKIVGHLMDAFDKGKPVDTIPGYFNKNYLPQILDLAGFEELPIELGKTKADVRLHDIKGTKQSNYGSGVIVEEIQRGFRRKDNGTLVRKAVVIKGE